MATTRITTTANATFQYTISPPAWTATLHGIFDRSLEGRVWVYVAGGDGRNDRRGASADAIVAKQTAAVPLDGALGQAQDKRNVAGGAAMGDEGENGTPTRGQSGSGRGISSHSYLLTVI